MLWLIVALVISLPNYVQADCNACLQDCMVNNIYLGTNESVTFGLMEDSGCFDNRAILYDLQMRVVQGAGATIRLIDAQAPHEYFSLSMTEIPAHSTKCAKLYNSTDNYLTIYSSNPRIIITCDDGDYYHSDNGYPFFGFCQLAVTVSLYCESSYGSGATTDRGALWTTTTGRVPTIPASFPTSGYCEDFQAPAGCVISADCMTFLCAPRVNGKDFEYQLNVSLCSQPSFATLKLKLADGSQYQTT